MSYLARLCDLVGSMQRDLEMDAYSVDEQNLIYALCILEETSLKGAVSSATLKMHGLCQNMSRPTFYRTLSRLVEKGVVHKAGDSARSGLYHLRQ